MLHYTQYCIHDIDDITSVCMCVCVCMCVYGLPEHQGLVS